MSRRSTKSKLRLATVEKSIEQLKRQYHTLQLVFINSYSFYTQTFLDRIASNAQRHLLKFPIQTLLSNIVKKFCMNELELLFMYHLFQNTEWDLDNKTIITRSKQVRIDEDDEYKQALLYFYMVAYATKYYLNGQAEADIFLAILTDEIPEFSAIFEEWMQGSSSNFMVIQPVELNQCFKEMTKKDTECTKTDYNKLVQQLLLISPSYKLIENIERTKLQQIKEIVHNHQLVHADSNKKSEHNPTKRIKLSLLDENDQQDVNNHLGNIFQSIQFMEDAPVRGGPVTRGSSCGMHEISEIGGFGKRKPSSDLSKMFNLQRSSMYDWP